MLRLRSMPRPAILAAVVAIVAVFAVPAVLLSYSVDDRTFYDGLSDLSAMDASATSNVALDSQGGLRLATDGTPTVSTWSSAVDFEGKGTGDGLVGQLTAEADAAGDASSSAGALRLRYTPMALDVDGANPIFQSVLDTTTVRADSYEVAGPSVVKVAAGDYRMYYSGVAADGYRMRIFEATSTDGSLNWAKVQGPGPGGCVLDLGAPGSFDEFGLVRPTVAYNASSTTPFRMWYGGVGKSAGTIGYATSVDGHTWLKHTDASGTPVPVVTTGPFGSADGYAVGEPSVTYDSLTGTYRMWYATQPSQDVKGRSVGYATSSETTANGHGAVWSKGGSVYVEPNGRFTGAWFSPGAWNESDVTYPQWMLFAGKQSGDQGYKLISAKSSDGGLNWTASNNVLSKLTDSWNNKNVYWASVLLDPIGSPADPYRIYYTGSGGDGDGTRNTIGYADAAAANNATSRGRAVWASSPGTRFDTNQSAQGFVLQNPSTGDLNMFYSGRSGLDLNWRIGVATASAEDTVPAWTRVDGTGDAVTKAAFALGGPGSFDSSGALSASIAPLDASSTALAMVYEGVNAAGTSAFGVATTTADATLSWNRKTTPIFGVGSAGAFDSAKIGHPSVVRTADEYRMYYAGYDGTDWEIGVTTSTAIAATWASHPATAAVTVGIAGSVDEMGASDPVVAYDEASTSAWRMWYTATAADGVSRVAYATSDDGLAWTKHGLAVAPSGEPWAFDEMGLRAASAWKNPADARWHVLYDGIDRGNFGNAAGSADIRWRRIAQASGSGEGYMSDGRATYSLVPTGTPVPNYKYDFRDFSWNSTEPANSSARLEVSFYPGYLLANGSAADAWSPYASLDSSPKPALPLFTEKIRWRVSLGRDAGATGTTPVLDEMRISWAPTHFCATGTALSIPVGPTAGKYVESWKNLIVYAEAPASGPCTTSVTVLDTNGNVLIPAKPISDGMNSFPVDAIPPDVTKVRVKFDFSGDGQDTVLVKNWSLSYVSTNRAPVLGFQAFGTATGTRVTWVNPDYEGLQSVKVLRSTVGFSNSPTETTTSTVVWDQPATAGSVESTEQPSDLGQMVYYTAYTYDGTGWSPPARTLAVRRAPLTKLTATAAGLGAKLAWTPTNASLPTSPGVYAGVTVARRETTAPLGPAGPDTVVVASDIKTGTATDSSARPGINTYYAAYIHDVYHIGLAYYDCYSEPVLATCTPLWAPLANFDAMGYSTKADLAGRVPESGAATYTLTLRRGGYTSVAISPTSGTSVLTTTVAAGQDIMRTVSSLTNLRSYWFTAFLTAKTSQDVTLTSEPVYAVAVPRTARLSGFKSSAGDARVSLYWTRKTYVAASTTYKYAYGGVRVIRGTRAYPARAADPTARIVVPGTTSSSSYADLNVVNLTPYYYRGYAGVRATTKSGPIVTDYDYGYPSSSFATPKFKVIMGIRPYSYRKYAAPYYYYPYGKSISASGTVAPNHAVFQGSTPATGYVTVYTDKKTYNSRTRKYYWKRIRTSTIYMASAGTSSTWQWTYRASRGYYRFRAYFKGDADHLAGYSTYKYAKIY